VPPAENAVPEARSAAVPAPAFGPRREARRGDRGRLYLRDGQVFEGRLVTTSDQGDVVDLDEGKRRLFPGHSVFEVEPLIELEPWAGLREGEVLAIPYDGDGVSGRLLERTEWSLEIEERSGARRSVRSDSVERLYGPTGPLPRPRSLTSPSRTRALWAQTGLVLDPGEVTLTWSQLLTAQAAVGVYRWVMLSAGTTVPVLYASNAGRNATLRLTVGAEVLPRLHLAAGMEAWLSSQGSVVSAFGAVTFREEAWWVSAYLGPPPTAVDSLGHFGERIVAFSAGWRFTPRLSAVLEAWSGLGTDDRDLLFSAAARIRAWGLDIDAGLATAPAARLVPVLSVSGTLRSP
jgi:hypothetical protein